MPARRPILVAPSGVTHRIKTISTYFKSVACGSKTFEVRRNDRGYAVGDDLVLLDCDEAGNLSGKELRVRVVYLLPGGEFGIHPDYCVMAIAEEERPNVFKRTEHRTNAHYSTPPHSNCATPASCDCECADCLAAWERAHKPGPSTMVIPMWAARGFDDAWTFSKTEDA